ncbi:hypothetical protein BsWGS_11411 [Bradybaena similaris]
MSHSLSDWQTVSSDCRLIKSRYRSRKCTLCVHLEDLKNSLRKYCRSLLKEGNQTARRNLLQRDTNIQTCNMARVRIPTTDVNIKKSNNQNMKLLAEKLLSSFAKKNASSVILENAASITGLKMLSSPKVHQRECNMEGINQVNVAHPSGSQLTQKNKRPCSLEKELQRAKQMRSSILLYKSDNTLPYIKICEAECKDSVPDGATEKTKQSHIDSFTSEHITMNDVQLDTCGQLQQNVLVQDTETCLFPTHLNQADYTDKINLCVVPHMLFVPETQAADDSSGLDSVCVTSVNTIKHNVNQNFSSQSLIIPSLESETANNQNNISLREDREILATTETPTVSASSSVAKMDDIKHNLNQNMFLSYTPSSSKLKDTNNQVSTNPQVDLQILNAAEVQTQNFWSKPDDVNNVTDRRHLSGQSMFDIQVTQSTELLLNPTSTDHVENGKENMNKNQHPKQTKHFPMPQCVISLCDVIDISDEDEDNNGHKQIESIHQDGHYLEPSVIPDPHDITLISHFISTDKSLQKSAHQNVPLGDGDGNIENTRRNANINNDSNSFLSLKQMTESAHSYVDSFDVVPKPVQHEYPHVSITRKKSDRNKLEAVSCQQCCKMENVQMTLQRLLRDGHEDECP